MKKRLIDTLKHYGIADRFVRRNPLVYGRALRLFERLEGEPLEERRTFTEQRLRGVLRAAARTEYGRSTGAGTDIARWPLLDRAEIRDDPARLLGRGRLVAATASTSGTSGVPLRLHRSIRSLAVEQAAVDRLLRAVGIDPLRARFATLRGDNPLPLTTPGPPYWTTVSGGRRLVFSSNRLNHGTIRDFAGAVNAFAPDVLFAYPSVLESFCRLLRSAGIGVSVPVTLVSSEMLTPGTRTLAEETLRTRLIDYYGQAERVAFAASIDGAPYRFLPGYAHVELVPVGEDGGSHLFEIVGTPLWNLTMPLVRYRTGDVVALPRGTTAEDRERIAYGVEPLGGIRGRQDDFLVSPDGGRLVGIDHIPREVEHVLRMQIVQETPRVVRVLVLAAEGFTGDDRGTIERNLRLKLPPEMEWSIELVDELERTQRSKTPLVIRRPEVEAELGADLVLSQPGD